MRTAPHLCSFCRSQRLTCQGHSPRAAALPPTILPKASAVVKPQSGAEGDAPGLTASEGAAGPPSAARAVGRPPGGRAGQREGVSCGHPWGDWDPSLVTGSHRAGVWAVGRGPLGGLAELSHGEERTCGAGGDVTPSGQPACASGLAGQGVCAPGNALVLAAPEKGPRPLSDSLDPAHPALSCRFWQPH